MPTQLPRRAANDNEMTTFRKIAVLERSVEEMLGDLEDADERRQVALMTLIAEHQRRILELSRGR
jgi:hypothetical protein